MPEPVRTERGDIDARTTLIVGAGMLTMVGLAALIAAVMLRVGGGTMIPPPLPHPEPAQSFAEYQREKRAVLEEPWLDRSRAAHRAHSRGAGYVVDREGK